MRAGTGADVAARVAWLRGEIGTRVLAERLGQPRASGGSVLYYDASCLRFAARRGEVEIAMKQRGS